MLKSGFWSHLGGKRATRLLPVVLGLAAVCAGIDAQADDTWGALAAGIDQEHGWVGTGYAVRYDTEEGAKERALAECRVVTPFACEILDTFTGCGFISTGESEDSIGWGTGPDAMTAYNNCQSQGLDCKAASGGCN